MNEEANTCIEVLRKAAQFGLVDCQCCPAYPICPTGTAGWNNECMLDTAADLIESLSAEKEMLNAAIGQLGRIECHRDMLEHALEQVTRERDAAVKDLKLWYCFSCNNRSTPYCQECSCNRVRLVKGHWSGRNHYEWRGVEVEG